MAVPHTLDELEAALGHSFANRSLLDLALTHRSVAHERAQQEPEPAPTPKNDNEQLEFLGDAVAGLLVADELFHLFPDLDEGGLTRMRAFLVSRRHLAEVALDLDLGPHLRLGRGEEQTGGRAKSALLANAFEAVLAAVYLDAGLDAARGLITRRVLPALDQVNASGNTTASMGDHKTALQQRMQAAGLGTPRYIVTDESGPDHRKHFTVEVRMATHENQDVTLGQATASSKKQAQQAAARIADIHLDAIKSTDSTKPPTTPEAK